MRRSAALRADGCREIQIKERRSSQVEEEDTMKYMVPLILLVLLQFSHGAAEETPFDHYFLPKTLRIDLFHTGTATTEVFSLDEVIEERFWAGNPRNLIDTLNLGGYIVRVFDLKTNQMIFSRGYATLYGEWVTTDEAARETARTFHESLILPYPRRPVQIRIDRRNRENIFENVFDLIVDPADYHIRREERYRHFKVRELERNASPDRAVDLVILAEGYQLDEIHKLRDDAKRLIDILFDTEPFLSRRRDFNVRLVESVSIHSGVDEPRKGKYRNTVLDLTYNAFDIDRYMLTRSNKKMRDVAARVPYDLVIVLANSERYGGGGIFNLYSLCISDNEFDGYVFVHELGHALAGLADEYYSSEIAYNDMYPRGIEPWERNITALLDPSNVKWGDLIEEGVPIPTPADSTYEGTVGCFEGAGYSAKGLYRSSLDCRMFSKSLAPFCPVCRRAIEEIIDFHTK
jgi:hypothetical protein